MIHVIYSSLLFSDIKHIYKQKPAGVLVMHASSAGGSTFMHTYIDFLYVSVHGHLVLDTSYLEMDSSCSRTLFTFRSSGEN